MIQEYAIPDLSSNDREARTPSTVPTAVANTDRQKAIFRDESGEPESIDPEISQAHTDIVEDPCSPEDSYKKLYAEIYKKAYDEAYQTACRDSFNRSYTAGFNAKFGDHYMKEYRSEFEQICSYSYKTADRWCKKHDALMKMDLDKTPFPNLEESAVQQTSTQITNLFNLIQDLEKNRKRDMAQRGVIQLFWGLLAMLLIYLIMDMITRRV